MRENLGSKSFQQALIPNELEIICKVSEEIYTPQGYRGVGCLKRSVNSEQWSVKARTSVHCSFNYCAAAEGYFTQGGGENAGMRRGLNLLPLRIEFSMACKFVP